MRLRCLRLESWLSARCGSRPPERRPDRVFYAQALPKTAPGKLDRRRVTELVMAEINRPASW